MWYIHLACLQCINGNTWIDGWAYFGSYLMDNHVSNVVEVWVQLIEVYETNPWSLWQLMQKIEFTTLMLSTCCLQQYLCNLWSCMRPFLCMHQWVRSHYPQCGYTWYIRSESDECVTLHSHTHVHIRVKVTELSMGMCCTCVTHHYTKC